MPTEEEKLLAILSQPEPKYADYEAEGVEEEELDEKQAATLASILNSEMPSPEEIIRDAKIAEHNAEVQRRRQEDLAKRRERRAKQTKLKKRRRR